SWMQGDVGFKSSHPGAFVFCGYSYLSCFNFLGSHGAAAAVFLSAVSSPVVFEVRRFVRYGVPMKAQTAAITQASREDEDHDSGRPPAWRKVRARWRERFGEPVFRRWLEPVTGTVETAAEESVLILTLPTRFMRDWVEAHYGETIRALWTQIAGK